MAVEADVPRDLGGGRLRDGLIAGAAAGLALAVATLVVRLASGTPSFPEILQDQILGVVPGSISGGIIDKVQFNSKPLLVAGIVAGEVAAGVVFGALFALLQRRRDGRPNWFGGLTA